MYSLTNFSSFYREISLSNSANCFSIKGSNVYSLKAISCKPPHNHFAKK
ncbi:hypothetical protein RMAECT_0895 [Rickettsia rhipicephali str. Ect]|uniref:Uncharacterized protein n=1 Tax=Rickettsia rhipicephali str. Ect TaxID=1359199 RepID=A0A0F3PEY3_RICRH|nr:hypothetical protein RMAECT_0895 [Rickettsia rhipicephali str. Ect]